MKKTNVNKNKKENILGNKKIYKKEKNIASKNKLC